MPDHIHLIWMGLSLQSDQLRATRFFVQQTNRILAGCRLTSRRVPFATEHWKLQQRPYDHVLKEKERRRNAFAKICFYILANPVRAGIVQKESEWEFCGAVVPGYPTFHPLESNYWELFWKYYVSNREDQSIQLPNDTSENIDENT